MHDTSASYGLDTIDPPRLGLGLAVSVALGAAIVLVFGWGLDIDWLRRVAPGLPAMVPATALTLLVGGAGTVVLLRNGPRWVPFLCAAAIFVIISLEQVTSLTPAELRGTDAMSMASVLCAALLGLSLLLRSLRLGTASILVDTTGLVVASIPLVGYVFGAQTLFYNPLYTLMALHTALAHVAIFLALLLTDPRRGWIEVLLSQEPGSRMARRVLPVTIVVPLLLALIVAEAVEREFMTIEFRLAVLTFLVIASTVTAVIGFAHLTNLAERRSTEAEAAYLRSEMHRQQTELAAARSEKVAALGKLVGGVAHDFNNTLNVILGNLELLDEDSNRTNQRTYLSEAIAASNRAAQLTRQLLAYGRKSQLSPKPIDLESEVDGAIAMFRRVCPANISITRQFDETGLTLRVDPAALQQAVLNVLINARDALPEGGEIHLTGRREHLSGATVNGFHGAETLPDGTYATLAIEDTGEGMTPEIAEQAAEPFFTTKKVGEGTGLGLSTVAGFCRQSDGGLRIDAAPGSGTLVTMAFPATSGRAAGVTPARDEPKDAAAAPGGVLIVDDDEALTRVMKAQLERSGHDVRTAHDATQALATLDAGPLPEVVLTDIVMPGEMQGHHLADRIRQRYPGIEVILMSGYASEAQREAIEAAAGLPFLQKPIDVRTLRTIVGRATTPPGETGTGTPGA
ncbi:response regulator [Roseovarius indicus]|uniref:histidine kinase n=1 Tax=Roseovarius indicus TaxID=540747 RepID=A0A5P3A7C8_9RHOB|nr:response regulator [Roseovarius indicus]QEW24268.1 Blue-light-activated protein [Roseovarius indicus]SFD73441.1 Signal transduction histidine kinase [Roseovarius indicus]